MKIPSSSVRLSLAAIVAILLSLSTSTALASPARCQDDLLSLGMRYRAITEQLTMKCVGLIREAIDNGKSLNSGDPNFAVSVVDRCDYLFSRLQTLRANFTNKCKTFTACTAADLHLLGHLVSGENAPGTGPRDFACEYTVERAQAAAVNAVFADDPAAQYQLSQIALGSGPGSDPGVQTQAFYKSNPTCTSTVCSFSLPNSVTYYSPQINPISPYAIPLPVNGTLIMDVCEGGGIPDALILGGSKTQTSPPINLGSPRLCPTTVNVVGYCDCGPGVAAPGYSYQLCRDSNTTTGDLCATGTAILSDDPGSSNNGPLYAEFGDTSVDGGCAGVLNWRYQIVLPLEEGADGVYCTADDTAAVLPATRIPFTTGITEAIIFDANDIDGFAISNYPVYGIPAASCGNLRSHVLTGMRFVGSGIAMDEGPWGDNIVEINLTCN